MGLQCRKHIPDHPLLSQTRPSPPTNRDPRSSQGKALPRSSAGRTDAEALFTYVQQILPPSTVSRLAPLRSSSSHQSRGSTGRSHTWRPLTIPEPHAPPLLAPDIPRVSPDTDGPSPRDGRPRSLARTVGNPVKPLRREDRPPRGSEFRFPRSPAAPRASNKHYYFPPASQLAPPFELAYMSLLLAVALFATHIPACQRRPP